MKRSALSAKKAGQLPTVKCPTCKKRGKWFAGAYGPFCSHRCKLVDLGKWLGEEYSVTAPLRPEHFAEFEDVPRGKHLDRPESD